MSLERLAKAFGEDVFQWAVANKERELMDANPAAGIAGFINLTKASLP